MNAPQMTALDKARTAWGADLPRWVAEMARACADASQAQVAKRMDYSPTVISQVLNRVYQGSYPAVQEVFEGAFEGLSIDCPALGGISPATCRGWREKARSFGNTNGQRVQMYRACRRCVRFTPPTGEVQA